MTSLDPRRIPASPRERRVWIITQLWLRGTSLAALARRAGVSQQAMSQALSRPAARLEGVIAEALGLDVIALFPERYSSRGERIPRTRGTQDGSALGCDNNINLKAAV